MKKFIRLIIGLSLLFLIVGCSSNTNNKNSKMEKTDGRGKIDSNTSNIQSTGPNGETATPASDINLSDEDIKKVREGNYEVAISFHYAGNDWSAAQQKGLEDTFKDLGIKIVGTTDANFSAEKQVSDLETLMALKPDALVSIPTDATATADAYKRVAASGIKIVFMDNVPNGFTAGKDYVSAVSADNYGNGVIAADLIGEKLDGKGNLGVVFYDVDFFVTNQRLEAFEKTMKEKYPKIKVAAKQGFADTNQVTEVADAMLTQHTNLDAIFAIWDIPAEGVLSALQSAGREDIVVSSIDLGDNIAKSIAQGDVLGVGAQLPYDQGVAEAKLIAYSLLGKEAPAYVVVPATRVDRSNVITGYETVYHKKAPSFLTDEFK